jgi:hypothetical protein
VVTLPGTTHYSRRVANEPFYFLPGLTYTEMARGGMGVRKMNASIFDSKSEAILPALRGARVQASAGYRDVLCLLSSYLMSWLLRVTAQQLEFRGGYVAQLPLPVSCFPLPRQLPDVLEQIKERLQQNDPTERSFTPQSCRSTGEQEEYGLETLLHTLEGLNEHCVCQAYNLDQGNIRRR